MRSTAGPARPGRRDGDDPVLPDQTADERAAGWGDEVREAESDPDDLRRFLDERPPHHVD